MGLLFAMTEEIQDQQPKSFILIKFIDTGSAIFTVNLVGVTPFQVMIAGNYLELVSKNQLVSLMNQQAEEREAIGLSKPNPKIILPGQ